MQTRNLPVREDHQRVGRGCVADSALTESRRALARAGKPTGMFDEIRGLSDGWKHALAREITDGYLDDLDAFITQQRAAGSIYPPAGEVLAAMRATPLDRVRVVIVGLIPTDTVSAPGSVRPLPHPAPGSCPARAAWVSACEVAA